MQHRNHFTITISDKKGIKQYNLHELMKRIILYFILFITLSFIIGGFTIYYLESSVEEITAKKEETHILLEKLQSEYGSLQGEIEDKERALNQISDKLEDIEEMIGLRPLKEHNLLERVDSATLTSHQKSTLLQMIPSGWPIEDVGISSSFGWRIHPTSKQRAFHRGIDLRAKMRTPIYSPADGVVEFAGYHSSSGFGNLIILNHSLGFKTHFAHLSKPATKSGRFVKKGELIGYTGNSGLSNGPHLHYEVRFIGRSLNPRRFIDWSITNYSEIFTKENQVPWQSLITAISHLGSKTLARQ